MASVLNRETLIPLGATAAIFGLAWLGGGWVDRFGEDQRRVQGALIELRTSTNEVQKEVANLRHSYELNQAEQRTWRAENSRARSEEIDTRLSDMVSRDMLYLILQSAGDKNPDWLPPELPPRDR